MRKRDWKLVQIGIVKEEIELCFLISDKLRYVICTLRTYSHATNTEQQQCLEGELSV